MIYIISSIIKFPISPSSTILSSVLPIGITKKITLKFHNFESSKDCHHHTKNSCIGIKEHRLKTSQKL